MPEQPVRDELDQGATLLELVERCEEASGPDRDLFEAAYEAVNGMPWPTAAYRHGALGEEPNSEKGRAARRFGELVRIEAWVDAAMTLVPEGFTWNAGLDRNEAPGFACCDDPEPFLARPRHMRAATPAIALCIAALKARAETPKSDPKGDHPCPAM